MKAKNYITANKEKMIVHRPTHLSGMKGAGVWDNIVSGVRSALSYAKKNKLISKGLTAAAPLFGTYAPAAMGAAGIANTLGYGRKRGRPKKAGTGLTLAGGMYQSHGRGKAGKGLTLAGAGKKAGKGLTLAGAGKKKKKAGKGLTLAGAGMKGCGRVRKQTVFP
jgi:hypothetical protein